VLQCIGAASLPRSPVRHITPVFLEFRLASFFLSNIDNGHLQSMHTMRIGYCMDWPYDVGRLFIEIVRSSISFIAQCKKSFAEQGFRPSSMAGNCRLQWSYIRSIRLKTNPNTSAILGACIVQGSTWILWLSSSHSCNFIPFEKFQLKTELTFLFAFLNLWFNLIALN